MRDLNPDLQSLVDATRDADGPLPDDRERVRRALAAQLGGAALLASTAATGSASAAGATSAVTVAVGVTTAASLSTKLAVVALIVAGGVGTAALTRPTHAPRGVVVTAPSAPALRPHREDSAVRSSTGAAAEALRIVAPTATTLAAVVHPRRASVVAVESRPQREEVAAPSSSLAEEVPLLRAARAALRSGEAARSLDLLTTHAARFPDGVMREERLALRVAALCDAGRRSEARAEAERFVREAPRSVFVERVRTTCVEARAVDSVTGDGPSRH